MGGGVSRLDETLWEERVEEDGVAFTNSAFVPAEYANTDATADTDPVIADGGLDPKSVHQTLDANFPTLCYNYLEFRKKGVVGQRYEYDVLDSRAPADGSSRSSSRRFSSGRFGSSSSSSKEVLYTTKVVPGTLGWFDVLGPASPSSCGDDGNDGNDAGGGDNNQKVQLQLQLRVVKVVVDDDHDHVRRQTWIVYRYHVPVFEGQTPAPPGDTTKCTEEGTKLYKTACVTVSPSGCEVIMARYGKPNPEDYCSSSCDNGDGKDDNNDEDCNHNDNVVENKSTTGSSNNHNDNISQTQKLRQHFGDPPPSTTYATHGDKRRSSAPSLADATVDASNTSKSSTTKLALFGSPTKRLLFGIGRPSTSGKEQQQLQSDRELEQQNCVTMNEEEVSWGADIVPAFPSNHVQKHEENETTQKTEQQSESADHNPVLTPQQKYELDLEGVLDLDSDQPIVQCQEVNNKPTMINNHQTFNITKGDLLVLLSLEKSQNDKATGTPVSSSPSSSSSPPSASASMWFSKLGLSPSRSSCSKGLVEQEGATTTTSTTTATSRDTSLSSASCSFQKILEGGAIPSAGDAPLNDFEASLQSITEAQARARQSTKLKIGKGRLIKAGFKWLSTPSSSSATGGAGADDAAAAEHSSSSSLSDDSAGAHDTADTDTNHISDISNSGEIDESKEEDIQSGMLRSPIAFEAAERMDFATNHADDDKSNSNENDDNNGASTIDAAPASLPPTNHDSNNDTTFDHDIALLPTKTTPPSLMSYFFWKSSSFHLGQHKMYMHLAKNSDLALHLVFSIIVNQVRSERNHPSWVFVDRRKPKAPFT